MKEFNEPMVEIVNFDQDDIITNSACVTSYAYGYNDCTSGAAPSCPELLG